MRLKRGKVGRRRGGKYNAQNTEETRSKGGRRMKERTETVGSGAEAMVSGRGEGGRVSKM
jgi:hypothetical protein